MGVNALFDMDNTLFDYQSQLLQDMKRLQDPNEKEVTELYDESKPWIKARMDLIKSVPGWWRDLPIYEPGLKLFNEAKKIGFTCDILTKGPTGGKKTLAWTEKLECIQKNLGDQINNINIVSRSKGNCYGRVLVDDYPEYVESWLKNRPRGLAILPMRKYNCNYKHKNAIIYDGENFEYVRQALIAAYVRENNQHWLEIM